MKQLLTLPTDLLTLLDEYKDFVLNNRPDKNLPNWKTKGKFKSEDRSEFSTSIECLQSMNAETRHGFLHSLIANILLM